MSNLSIPRPVDWVQRGSNTRRYNRWMCNPVVDPNPISVREIAFAAIMGVCVVFILPFSILILSGL